jgi:hypothetical protein
MTHARTAIALTALAVALAACDEKPSAPKAAAPVRAPAVKPAAPAPAATAPGAKLSALGLTFALPEGWKQVPPSNTMRLAEIQVPDASGDAAKMCTIAFSTAGGDVQANIDRWAGQVHDAAGQAAVPKSESRSVAGMKVTITELSGSYAGMGEATPRTNWMLRGAIIESPDGLLFIKMTGPEGPMASAAAAFNVMVDGLTKP